jgi:hypothetical protein
VNDRSSGRSLPKLTTGLTVQNHCIRMDYTEISSAGTKRKVRSVQIQGRSLFAVGRYPKIAAIKDEEWQEGEALPRPRDFIAEIKRHNDLGADLFTFSQKPTDATPRFDFYHEWDSIAAIRTLSFSDWWANRVSTDLRCDVRKAAKRGVIVRPVSFDDNLVRAIMDIYDETPVRQGRAFWHYKKPLDAVKAENATYLERAEFLGAFLGEELIGFLKLVYVDNIARMMQILSKESQRKARPMNALIAKAVETCEARGCTHLTYGNYRYVQGADSVTAFKQRNGFEELLVPRYYVPLTTKGRLALRLRLHRGAKALVPDLVLRSVKRIRASIYRNLLLTRKLT